VQSADEVEALRDYASAASIWLIGHTGRFLSPPSASAAITQGDLVVGSGSGGAGTNVASIDYDNTHSGI